MMLRRVLTATRLAFEVFPDCDRRIGATADSEDVVVPRLLMAIRDETEVENPASAW